MKNLINKIKAWWKEQTMLLPGSVYTLDMHKSTKIIFTHTSNNVDDVLALMNLYTNSGLEDKFTVELVTDASLTDADFE